MTTYGVLGVGSIAESIVTGLCDGVADPPTVVLSPRNAVRTANLATRYATVHAAADNQSVLDRSDVVIVCVLPQLADEVLGPLHFGATQSVVSVMAGVHLSHLLRAVAPAADVARSIPLPAVATRSSTTPVHPPTTAAVTLYDRLGGTMGIDDELAYESVSAASGTVTAYLRYLGAVADWLSAHGIAEPSARHYVAATFAGLSRDLGGRSPDFAVLAAVNSTAGGLNEQFARHLESVGTFSAIPVALDEILARIAPPV